MQKVELLLSKMFWLSVVLAVAMIAIELVGGVHMDTHSMGPLNAITVRQTAHVWGVEVEAEGPLGYHQIAHLSWSEWRKGDVVWDDERGNN